MKKRKLFQAKDEGGKLHYIDNLDKEALDGRVFFCPYCDDEVMPKMGEKKVWHFAHIGKTCSALSPKKTDTTEEKGRVKDIWSFTRKYTVGSDFKLDPQSYQCEICKVIEAKEYGIRWNNDIFICKGCYRQLSKDKINELQWKSMI